MPGSKDRDGMASRPKGSILGYPRVLDAFKQPPVQQDQPPQVQQDPPPPQQPPPSPEERWYDPDEFLASSDLYLAQAPFSSQKRKSSPPHTPTSPRPTKSPHPPNSPDDEEEIQDFLRLCDLNPRLPTSKPKSSLQSPRPATASPPTQASVAATAGPEGNSSSQQQKPHIVRTSPARRIPKEKDPPDLDFREDHFG